MKAKILNQGFSQGTCAILLELDRNRLAEVYCTLWSILSVAIPSPPLAAAVEEQPSSIPPPTHSQPDRATALLTNTTNKMDWGEEMEDVAPNEQFVTRSVSFFEESTTPITRRVLIKDPTSFKDRLGLCGAQRDAPQTRPVFDSYGQRDRYGQNQNHYVPGPTPPTERGPGTTKLPIVALPNSNTRTCPYKIQLD